MALPAFMTMEPIDKGWSGDQKYCVTTDDGTKYMLRISPEEKSSCRAGMFRVQRAIAELGVPIARPIAFGTCDEGVYMLDAWIDGEDAEEVVPYVGEQRQYALGLEAGSILKRMHTVPAPRALPEWSSRFGAKMDRNVARYRACVLQLDGAQQIIAYMQAHRRLLVGRPQTFQHGDYHIGNMMIEHGKIVIIDFDRYDFGDPWEEFNRIVWCAQEAPTFACGMIDGYFGADVPDEFWTLLALYIGSNTLGSIHGAEAYGAREQQTMLNQARDVLTWYDNMKNPVPTWYEKGKMQGVEQETNQEAN